MYRIKTGAEDFAKLDHRKGSLTKKGVQAREHCLAQTASRSGEYGTERGITGNTDSTVRNSCTDPVHDLFPNSSPPPPPRARGSCFVRWLFLFAQHCYAKTPYLAHREQGARLCALLYIGLFCQKIGFAFLVSFSICCVAVVFLLFIKIPFSLFFCGTFAMRDLLHKCTNDFREKRKTCSQMEE